MGFSDQNFFEGNLHALGSSVGSLGSPDVSRYVSIWQYYYLSIEVKRLSDIVNIYSVYVMTYVCSKHTDMPVEFKVPMFGASRQAPRPATRIPGTAGTAGGPS